MSVILQYRGRVVTDADVVRIKQLMAAHPTLSRRALSKKLCEAWNWVQPNGHPRDMVCRGLMLALHRAGHIELPEPRLTPRNPLAQRSRPAVVEIDRTPLHGSLSWLGPLRFQQVRRTGQEALLNSLIEQHHYLGYTQPVGEQLYGHPVCFLETFVDPTRHRGTCYLAANWIVLGKTFGRGHRCPTMQPNRSVKQVLGYPLVKRFRELLGGVPSEG